jgi:hypothetical protein
MTKVLQLASGKLVTADNPDDYVYLTTGKVVETLTQQNNALQLSSGKLIGVTGPTPPVPGYPDSDVTVGVFSPSSGSLLWAMLDEEPYSDSDYVSGSVADGTNEEFEVGIENCAGNGTATLRVRLKSDLGEFNNLDCLIRLEQGGVDKGNNGVETLTAAYDEYTASCSGITDYTDLTVYVEFQSPESTNETLTGYCSWIKVDSA